MTRRPIFAAACALLSGGCGGPVEVDHPFYLWSLEGEPPALFRCAEGPGRGCAIDGLPGPEVMAAGANRRYVTVETTRGYYYFARVPNETRGWGRNPERIVGPLDQSAFAEATARLALPPPTVRP